MKAIRHTIRPSDTGESPRELIAGLSFLLAHAAIPIPGAATASDLEELAAKLQAELDSGQPYGGYAQQLVQLLQLQNGLGDHLRGEVDEKTADLLNALLKKHGAFDSPSPHRAVKGRVSDPMGRPCKGVKVVAFDRDLFEDQRLGDVHTDAEGHYRIEYTLDAVMAGEGLPLQAADLEVQVLATDSTEPLAVSAIRFNAGELEIIDLVVPMLEALPIEFDEVARRLTPMLGDRSALALDDGHAAFIVGDTGLDIDAVRAWIAGARLQSDALRLLGDGGEPKHLQALLEQGWRFGYAWHRMGRRTTLNEVLASEPAVWEAALEGGAERYWIAPIGIEERSQLVAALSYLRSLADLEPSLGGGAFAEAMAPFVDELPRDITVAALRLLREGGDAALDKLEGLAGDNAFQRARLAILARAIRLHALAEGHAGLIEPLMGKLDGGSSGIGGLMVMGASDWNALVDSSLPDDPQRGALAYRMQSNVEQRAPAEALLTRIDQGSVAIAHEDPDAFRQAMVENIDVVNGLMQGVGVEPGNGFVEAFPEQTRTIVSIGQFVKIGVHVDDGAKFVKTGHTLPHLITNFGQGMPIGPDGPEGPLGVDLHPTIIGIINGLKGKFRDGLGTLLNPGFTGPAGNIREGFFIDPSDSGFEPIVVPPTLPGISSPTVRGMFGDIDDCLCRPCESVTGPAAYLVELLRALQREVVFNGGGGLPLLRARRPDILDLELSCENSDVLVPHIDLALEQLEWLVAKSTLKSEVPAARSASSWLTPSIDPAIVALLQKTVEGPIDSQLEAFERARNQPNENVWLIREKSGVHSWLIETVPPGTGGTRVWRIIGMAIRRSSATPDPRLEPAHRNPEAYRLLGEATAVFPWTLPFAPAQHDRRALLESLRVDPLQLGPLLPAYGSPVASTGLGPLDVDTLRLSDAETQILVTIASGDALWRAWGFDSGASIASIDDPASGEVLSSKTPAELLQRASFLLARSALRLEDLEAALGTAFVGGYALSHRGQCKTSLMRAERAAGSGTQLIDGAALDRLHRLARLWRALPEWPLSELDRALSSMQGGATGSAPALGMGQLRLLAAMERARRALRLSASTLLDLRLPLDSPSGSALWQQRHAALASSLARPIAEVLELLQWLGFGPTGLGASADPLRAAVSAIDSSTATPEVRLAQKLAARATDFDLLGSLQQWSAAFARCDVALPALVAAQLPALQDRQSQAPRPAGARTSAALSTDLLALRRKLSAVPEPRAQATGQALIAELTEALGQLGWTDVLLETLAKQFDNPPAAGFSAELRDALVVQAYPRAGTRRESPLLTESELTALAATSITVDQRFGIVLDRLAEHSGTSERDVATRLAVAVGEAAANALLLQLKSTDAAIRAEAAKALSSVGPAGRFLGESMPLLSAADAMRFENPGLTDTWARRLDLIDTRLAERERERVLQDEVTAWAAQRGAAWPASAVSAFLGERLSIAPASATSNTPVRRARDDILSPAFFRSSSASPPADLTTWIEDLDTVLALRALSARVAALSLMPGLDWRALLRSNTGQDERGSLVRWIGLLDARRLGAETVAKLLALDTTKDLAIKTLAERLQVDVAELDALAVRAARLSTGSVTLQQLRNPKTLETLFELVEAARRLKASAQQLDSLLGADATAAIATGKALLRSMVGDREWPGQWRRICNEGRRRRRDALVSYLVQRMPGAKDADGLLEHALIDPQVQSCMETTRLKQATAAVQMLIQRILEGLEPGAQATEKLRNHWTWMRAYRLWEANRKVFLYPENWLLPELRDDKSPEFRAFESRLAEDELTAARADQAFGQFLEDVNRAAQTRVIGMFENVDVLPNFAGTRPKVRDLLVVGRTPNPPYVHYWRQCRDFGKRWMEWSPWERVEADIQSDHVAAFVSNNAMFLAWPLIEDTDKDPKHHWKVELAWSRFDGASWSRVNASRGDAPRVEKVPLEDRRSALALRAHVPTSGHAPEIFLYAKDAALGTANEVPQAVATTDETLLTPPWLLEEDSVPKLAELVAAAYESLPKNCRDRVEFFMHWYRGLDGSTAQRTVGYTEISEPDLFLDPEKMRWHLGIVRGDDLAAGYDFLTSVDDTEKAVRRDVVRQRKEPNNIQKFLYRFRIRTSTSAKPNPYSEFVDRVVEKCSAVEFSFVAWARLDGGLVRIDGEEAEFRLAHPATGQAGVVLRPGQSTALLIRAGHTPGDEATLSISKAGRTAPPPSKIQTRDCPVGTLRKQLLPFIFEDRGNLFGFTLPATQRDYRQLVRFTNQKTGVVDGAAGNRSPLETLDANSSVWMGGLREVNQRMVNGALQLIPPSFPLSIRRFGQTSLDLFRSSNAAHRYELIAASVPGSLALNHTGIWHFSEGNGSCFIDAVREPDSEASSARTLLYPNAWLSGDRLLQIWCGSRQLPNWREQHDDFGVCDLPTPSATVVPHDVMRDDPGVVRGRGAFDNRMPNSIYWWEICLHAPLAIADQLSRQQRFQEADHWLRMVFDPLTSTSADPQAFLRFRRFRELPRALGVRSDLNALAKAAASPGAAASPSVERVKNTIDRWKSQPFRPFVIARQRHIAFLWQTLFAYLDNLMGWADSLYRRETRESIQEAVLLYIQVARLLGARPRRTKKAGSTPKSSFVDYQDEWDEFANRWINALPSTPASASSVWVESDEDPPVEGMLYFCVPPNDALVRYWELIEERLRNIRHCRSIDGVERSLPIEAPEIDVGELVRAVASGGSIDEFVAESFAQPWPYRYATLLTQAKELVNDVKNLGAQLLGALEKRDAEQLALLRSTHEIALLDRVTEVRQLQIVEAERQVESLRSSREAVAARYEQIQHQLGNESAKAPERDESAGPESRLGRLSTGNQHAPSNLGLITQEADQLSHLAVAGTWTDADSVARLVAWGFNSGSAVASFAAVFEPSTGGSTTSEKVAKALGGLGTAAGSTADGFRAIAQIHQTQASKLAQTAGNIRRRDEWAFQSNQALRELATLDKQLKASEARLDIVRKEHDNHLQQREQAKATDTYLRDKFTSSALYHWQSGQLQSLYRSTFGLALGMARRARNAAERELGKATLPRIGSSHWDAGKSGLLAAERLQRELKLLELSVLEQHTRDLELTRHVSLKRLDPQALVDFIAKGRGEFEIPEWLFDLDAPGHYLRRIKSVSVSIPCVTGPYTSTNAKLSLLRSDTRVERAAGAGYEPDPDSDSRFETRFHASESIFVSTGRDDTGLFETSLRDERYLPFEGAGAVSTWRIEFPSEIEQFDRTTIDDVIIHLRYTARDGGSDLAEAAKLALAARWATNGPTQTILVACKAEFPAEWARAAQSGVSSFDVALDAKALLPYGLRAAGVARLLDSADLMAVGLRRAAGSTETIFEPIANATLQAGRLSVPVPVSTGWGGLQDIIVIVSAAR